MGGQTAEPVSPPGLLRLPSPSALLLSPSLEPFLHFAFLALNSPESPLPTALTTASGLPSQPQSRRGRSSFVAEPQKVTRIGIHDAKTAKKMDVKKLAEYVVCCQRSPTGRCRHVTVPRTKEGTWWRWPVSGCSGSSQTTCRRTWVPSGLRASLYLRPLPVFYVELVERI